ncbi:MAG: KilA-N domain-containing protein [Sphingomonadales bacterium]|nr:KilA-N domain-containing protein [Sphingomonadales bacterium]
MTVQPGQQLALIPHDYQGQTVTQRTRDGFINATAMCRVVGRSWSEYRRHKNTEAFLQALALDLQIPQVQLTLTVQGTPGGDPRNQGTWVHPQVAVHLASWLSPEFAVQVTKWVMEWQSGRGPNDHAWRQFQDRVSLTHNSVPDGYFCIFHETASIYATLIENGANPGTRMILDISAGLHWGNHWRDHGLAAQFGAARKFDHFYPPYFPQALSNPQKPWCYPDAALPEFRRWMKATYEPVKLPAYLNDQVRQGKLAANDANGVLAAIADHARRKSIS